MIGATRPSTMRTGSGSASARASAGTVLPASFVQQLMLLSAGRRAAPVDPGYMTPPAVLPLSQADDVFHSPDSQRGPADGLITIATNQIEEAVRTPVDGPRRNLPQRSTNEEHCIICLESEVTTKVMPCGHTHFCLDCAGLICNGAVGDPPRCPLCRELVTTIEQATQENIAEQVHERPQASSMMENLASVMREIASRNGSNAIVPHRSQFAPTVLPQQRRNIITEMTALGTRDGPQ